MKTRGASTVAVAGTLIVGLLIGAGAIYALAPSLGLVSTSTASGATTTKTATTTTTAITTTTVGAGATVTATTTVAGGTTTVTTTAAGAVQGINGSLLIGAAQAAGNISGTFTVGVLEDLTSDLASQGISDKATTQLAITDINSWLATTPLAGKVTFVSNIQDYALDNAKASTIMNSFLTQGIHVVVGPLNSGTAGALIPFANSNHVVMISQSSTNPNIAIPWDYLYRTPPADQFQAKADKAEFVQSGVQDVVIVYRNDGYGAGLANATAAEFKAAGGHVEASIPYDTTTSNFVPILGTVNDAYNSAVGKYGATHVALYFISFGEFGKIAAQASTNYAALLKTPLPWFGTDGEGNQASIVNSTFASTVIQTRMAASFPGFTDSKLTQSVCARQLAAVSTLCDGYSVGAYDDTWLAALAILYCHGQDGVCIHAVIPSVAATFNGASGVPILNTAGDRLYASYVFFCIVPGTATGSAKWIVCGTWDQATDKVVWTAKPSGLP
ncbi:MAG: ABC transporter substrate-binding protein [Thaumarchaeota archaeon]|nr:ABC transporter substrate-binding protein [Nitrososphaerota archaeon]